MRDDDEELGEGFNADVGEMLSSPFLSRPRGFAELLVHATTTTPTGPLVPH